VQAPSPSLDLVQIIQDFPPAAHLGWHTHDFPVFVLVLAGQATVRRDGAAFYAHAGGSLGCGPGVHTMGNEVGNQSMRRLVTLLAIPGLPLTRAATGPFTPTVSPTTFATSRTTVAQTPATFDFIQVLFSIGPGVTTAPYTFAGPNVGTVVTGEVTMAAGGQTTALKAAQLVTLPPGQAATFSNGGTAEATIGMSILQPPGLALAPIAQAAPASPIRPPSTGSGGLLSR
jgi:quercetin dioxygenase-like cupin family protein